LSKKKKKKESWKEKRRQAAIKHQKALEAERLKREREPRKSKGWSKGKIFGVAFMFLLIIGIYGAWQYTQPPSSNNPNTNKQKAPLFALQDLDGNTVALESLTGKVVVLNFFDLDCPPCLDEIPDLSEIHEQYSQSDVVILSIDVHPHIDTVSKLQEFRNTYQVGWKILVGTSEVSDNYNIQYTPTTFVVDRNGFIYGDHENPYNPYAYVGWDSSYTSELKNEIDHFLGS
jgi:peroxiredoxin